MRGDVLEPELPRLGDLRHGLVGQAVPGRARSYRNLAVRYDWQATALARLHPACALICLHCPAEADEGTSG
jgi:hypothetical protein